MTEQMVERRIVTVLFCDLVGFTTLSEELDAEDVATIQDAYFAMVRDTVGLYGGRLEKFIGDAAMAVFGVPRARDDDAQRAVRAGLALVGGIQQIGARLGLDEGALRLRVGVNTGEAVAAAEGGPDEGRVTGDTVNTAARLQTAAQPMTVYIGEATALAVADVAELESVGGLELKGKAEPTSAWTITGMRAEASREQAMGALRAPTLGRATELAALSEAAQRVAGGAVERWLIVAPPGVGKSRLLREFAGVVEVGGGLVWRTRARPESLSPFDPIARLLLDALGSAGVVADHRDALHQRLVGAGVAELRAQVIADAVASVLAPPTAAGEGKPSEDRDALFGAWLDALDVLAGRTPIAWLVEDVHWAGGDVLSFLAMATERTTAPRLIVATARPSLLESEPEWCREDLESGRHVLQLSTLDAADARGLVQALVGEALPGDLVERIAERSDGNCLFIEELLRTWVSVGTLVAGAGESWRLTVPADTIPMPTSVQSIYAAQLDDLPPDARLLARRASVAGRRFPVRALEPLGLGSGSATDAGLDPLRRRELVTGPLAEPVWGEAFAYRHALLRDAGYASLARAERARLHARLGRWLVEAAGGRSNEVAETIAGHYASALESAPALAREIDDGLDRAATQRLAADWYERAGQAALALAAHDAARTLLRRSIDLTARDALLDRARRWERLGEATAFAADMDEGAAAYEQAIEHYRSAVAAVDGAERIAARSGLARSVGSLCDVWFQQLRFAESHDLAVRVIDELGDPDQVSLARLLIAKAMGRQAASGPSDETESDLARAVELARAGGDPVVELHAFDYLTVVRSEAGHGDVAAFERIEQMATKLGDWPTAMAAMSNAASMLVDEHASEVFPHVDRVREMAHALGRLEDAGWADYLGSEAGFVSGEWDRAYELGLRAVDLGEKYAYRRLTVRTYHVLVPIATVRGDPALLKRASDWYATLSGPLPNSPYARLMRPAQDLSFAEAGLIPRVTLEVEPRISSYQEEPGGGSWTAAADKVFSSWLSDGSVEGAAQILEAMTAALEGYANVSSLGRGTYELLRARLALARGDPATAAAAADAALERFRVSQAPWWMAKAMRVALRAGSGGLDLEREVVEIEQRLGAVAPTA